MKQKYEEVVLGGFRSHNRGRSEPYAIYFVIIPEKNVVVKGMADEVSDYVKKNFKKAIWRYTYWHGGESRGGWGSTHMIYISDPGKIPGQDPNKHPVMIFGEDKSKPIAFSLRRIPKKWIPQYDLARKNPRYG